MIDKKYFVFVCGCGHTGTTILGRMLGSHSKISLIPEELGVFLANRYYRRDELIAPYLERADANGEHIIIDKTPRAVWHVDYIRRVWPNSKFIICTRNGPDTVTSIFDRTKDFDSAMNRYSDDSIMSIRQIDCDDVFLSRHEDLLDDPEKHISSILNFLGVEYEKSTIEYWKTPIEWNLKSSTNALKPTKHDLKRNKQVNEPLKNKASNWKDKLPKEHHKKIIDFFSDSSLGGRIMADLGYKY